MAETGFIIPRIETATNPVFYRSHISIDGYSLKTEQPRYFGWFDLDAGHGFHFTAKIFRDERWILGRHITTATKDEFLNIQLPDDIQMIRSDFDATLAAWLASTGQTDTIEWWLQ